MHFIDRKCVSLRKKVRLVENVEGIRPLNDFPPRAFRVEVRRPDVPPAPYSTLGVPHQYYLPDRQTDSMKVANLPSHRFVEFQLPSASTDVLCFSADNHVSKYLSYGPSFGAKFLFFHALSFQAFTLPIGSDNGIHCWFIFKVETRTDYSQS